MWKDFKGTPLVLGYYTRMTHLSIANALADLLSILLFKLYYW